MAWNPASLIPCITVNPLDILKSIHIVLKYNYARSNMTGSLFLSLILLEVELSTESCKNKLGFTEHVLCKIDFTGS